MNTLAENPIKSINVIIQRALEFGMTYGEYRELVQELAIRNSNTGPEKTEALANYTQLNTKRMDRWDKTLRIPNEVVDHVKALKQKMTWLVLTESWCGDASPSLPVMNKLAELTPNLDLKIVLRDEHPELMDLFLTNGTRSIPKVIVLDSLTQKVLGEWGPRSSKATKMVLDYKAEHGQLIPEFKQQLQVFYNKDKGQDILKDLVELLSLE
ncbi:thioredoxin family protein [Muricauda sp. SCSIO 64092]|uniref:thioredoxin family protein n=1 Tax=Allomuricauda sp. SCSIO 64092 TaxID=2908842 RepID=UPI001FF29391|nr:thioredoxin family protein [Muricauda sp. SCSIO 64092]UOY04774.1 thioredoxin family protein [Muricauda sp. SCSIO 64092]